jgi:arylsulfatase A-like enzyme
VRRIYTVAPGFKQRSFRVGNLKLIEQQKKPLELYDVDNDPSEKNDLAKQSPEKVAELKAAMDAYARADRDAEVK